MLRFLPTGLLLLLTTAARAQQADSLAALLPDSLASRSTLRISDPSQAANQAGHCFPGLTTLQPALSRVAGVQVTPYSGAPGAWAAVRIRGVSQVTGYSQPLYVVDGVPVYSNEVTPERWSSAENFFTNNGFSLLSTPNTPSANPLLDVPMEEIEQIEVLKGAAATARYGSQSTNGVVLIRTRRGGPGATTPQPLRVRYAGWAGVQQVRQRYEVLGARPYADLANAAAATYNQPPRYSPADLNNLQGTDWQDQVLRVAGIQSHNLSFEGRAHHTGYYVAADYLQQTGVVKASDLSRYHLRVNLDQQLTSKLSLGLKASASQTDQHYAGRAPDAGLLLRQSLLAPPVLRATPPAGLNPDPLSDFHNFSSAPRTRRLIAQLSANYQVGADWRLTVRGSREVAEARSLGSGSPPYLFPGAPPKVIQSITATSSSYTWVADAGLHYQHTFAREHALTASFTYLRQQFEYRLERNEETSYSRNNYQVSGHSTGIHSPAACFNYSYAGRYEVQASLRTDFAFSDDYSRNAFYWFPGAQASWHLNREAFLAGATGLSDLTLWTGTGRTGSLSGLDRTTQQDAGLRVGVLGGRLTLDLAAYQRRTAHAQTQLALPLPAGTGTTYISPDVTLQNQGLELTVASTWRRGALGGTTQVAAATNRNRTTSLSSTYTMIGTNSVLQEGESVSSFYVFEQNGVYPVGTANAGQMRFRDRNNDGQIDSRDGFVGGTGLPRYTLSFYQQLRVHRFQLEAQLDGLFGYQLLNSTLTTLDTPTGNANSSPRALDYWTPTHQNTSVPRAGTYEPAQRLSEQALENGNHVRLSQLTLSCEVRATGPRRASVWVGGQNLFVTGPYRGFDPNVSGGGAAPMLAGQDGSVYPVARVWQAGVRATF